MTPTIVRNFRRPDREITRRLGDLGASTVLEAQNRAGLINPALRPIFPGARIAGPAVTVLCQPGDNLMVHAAVEVCQPGDVLVVTTMSESTDALIGELISTSLHAHGVVGIVVDAGVRDVAELTAMQFPAWAKAISAQGPVKATAGSVNVEIVCGGAIVHPGDVIVGDLDGVVVVPLDQAAEVARLGMERRNKEERIRERLHRGELALDIFGLRDKLAALGVEYRDEKP